MSTPSITGHTVALLLMTKEHSNWNWINDHAIILMRIVIQIIIIHNNKNNRLIWFPMFTWLNADLHLLNIWLLAELSL